MFSTIFSDYSENHIKHINTLRGQNAVYMSQCVLHGVTTVLNRLMQFTLNCGASFHFSEITFDSPHGIIGIIPCNGIFRAEKSFLGNGIKRVSARKKSDQSHVFLK